MVIWMHDIDVAIVYAMPTKQWLVEKRVARGTSAMELLQEVGFLNDIETLKTTPLDDIQFGIYSQKVSHDHLLEQGDRVEVYRPLSADPKEVRRQLALLGKTMGKGAI